MVKISGTNFNIILAILYVYYWEISADMDKIDFWEPNRKFDGTRRAKKKLTPLNKTEKGTKLRNKDHVSYTRGHQVDLSYSSPKYIPKNGRPHIGPILRIHDDSNSDSDYEIDSNSSREKKQHNYETDRNHNAVKYYKTDENNDTKQNVHKNLDLDKKINSSKDRSHNKGIDHTNDEDFKKDRDHKKDKDHDSNKDNKRFKNHDNIKDHKKNKDHNINKDNKKYIDHDIDKENKRYIEYHINKDHQNDHKYKDHDRDKDHNKEDDHKKDKDKDHHKIKYHNMEKEHGKENDHENIKYNNKEKEHSKDKDHYNDKNHHKDHELRENHDVRNDQKTDIQHHIRERFKNKKHVKIGGPMTLPASKHQAYKQDHILESVRPAYHHDKSKIRKNTHKEMHSVESTRITPMYLMQQDGEDGGKGHRGMTQNPALPDPDAEDNVFYLSPYSIKKQVEEILKGFKDISVTTEVLGRSAEYNDIVMFKIIQHSDKTHYFRAEESKYVDEVPEKKIIFIVHGLSVMGMAGIEAMSTVYGVNLMLILYLSFLNIFDIYFIPMANPDGYAASHSKTLWNKNVSPQDACPGVAVDRNFDVAWNASRQISSCSQLFPGPSPFSEVESKAIRDVLHFHGHKIQAYIHVHAGTYDASVFKGDAILYPKGYSETQSDDDKYIDLKGEIDEAMKNASFQVLSVTVDTLHNWYGKVTGSSVDYASTVYGIPYALEFVMQKYASGGDDSTRSIDFYAMREIWGRLIHTTFTNVWKSLRVTNEVKKK